MLNIGTILALIGANILVSVIINALAPAKAVTTTTGTSVGVHVVANPISYIGNIVSVIVGVIMVVVLLNSVRGQKIALGAAFSAGMKRIVPYFLFTLMYGILFGLGLLLFIIPGIIVAIRGSLGMYYVVDQQMGPIEAFKASWAATKGNSGKVWGIIGVAFLIILPVFTIIGIVVTLYLGLMYSAAMALLYEYLRGSQPAAVLAAPAPMAPPVAS